MNHNRVFLSLVAVVCAAMGSSVVWASSTLDFEDADGVTWNGNLYGEPIFGPGEDPGYYHGFYLEGWRVLDKDGIAGVYGTNNYLYLGTNGDRSVSRFSFDCYWFSRAEDYYFEGVSVAAVDTYEALTQYPVVVRIFGSLDGTIIWTEDVIFDNNDGLPEVIHFTSSHADELVDSVGFNAWEFYLSSFILDDFRYSDVSGSDPVVPVPGAVWLLGVGLLGLRRIRRSVR